MQRQQFILLACTSLCVIYSLSESPSPRPNRLKQLFLQDVNGGTTCATCTVIVGLAEQLAEVYNVSIAEALAKYCAFFPSGFQELCRSLVDIFAPQIIELLINEATPDIMASIYVGTTLVNSATSFPYLSTALNLSYTSRCSKRRKSFKLPQNSQFL